MREPTTPQEAFEQMRGYHTQLSEMAKNIDDEYITAILQYFGVPDDTSQNEGSVLRASKGIKDYLAYDGLTIILRSDLYKLFTQTPTFHKSRLTFQEAPRYMKESVTLYGRHKKETEFEPLLPYFEEKELSANLWSERIKALFG